MGGSKGHLEEAGCSLFIIHGCIQVELVSQGTGRKGRVSLPYMMTGAVPQGKHIKVKHGHLGGQSCHMN